MRRFTVEEWHDRLPERKLELIDHRLAVGDGRGNLLLLQVLLEGWGADAAVALTPHVESWWQALEHAFRRFDAPRADKPAAVWQAWAKQLTYTASCELPAALPEGHHNGIRQAINMGLFRLLDRDSAAIVAGRDVIMRLGEDAFTPDVFVAVSERSRITDRYLDGPADWVIEVAMPGHDDQDRVLKKNRYEAARVPEYWIVDYERRQIDVLVLEGGNYQTTCHRSSAPLSPQTLLPGLKMYPERLWQAKNWYAPNEEPFVLEGMPTEHRVSKGTGVDWGDLPFAARPALEPLPLTFAEFASWAPEAKFELIEGVPWVGGSLGSRNVLGMLLRTEGQVTAASLLHPREWIDALARCAEDRAADQERRQHWWSVAREAAAALRARFGYRRLVLIGDLAGQGPLNVWSTIKLVAFDGKCDWDAAQFLYQNYRDEPDIHLVEEKHLTRSERVELSQAGIEV